MDLNREDGNKDTFRNWEVAIPAEITSNLKKVALGEGFHLYLTNDGKLFAYANNHDQLFGEDLDEAYCGPIKDNFFPKLQSEKIIDIACG